MNINTKKLDSIFKTRSNNQINIYDNNKSLYVDDQNYYIKSEFELDKKSLIYEKKPIISFVSKIKNREQNVDYIKFFMKKSKDLNEKSNNSEESKCNSCFANII